MRDEPDAELRSPSGRSSDPTKGVDSYRQQGGGHGSRNPLSTSVKTHLPNELALKMDGAEAVVLDSVVMGGVVFSSQVGGRGVVEGFSLLKTRSKPKSEEAWVARPRRTEP